MMRLKKLVLITLGTGTFLTGAIGLLHLPAAAPILRRISPASVCPLTRGTPEQVDRGNAIAGAAIRAATPNKPAPARPALGFELDGSRIADVDRWASDHKLTCKTMGGVANLKKCTDVPGAALGQAGTFEEVTFGFRSTGELVNVQTLRRHLPVSEALSIANGRERDLAEKLGPPSTVGGTPTVAHLTHGPLQTYVAEHQFTDYRATVSATNLLDVGFMVREQYFSAKI